MKFTVVEIFKSLQGYLTDYTYTYTKKILSAYKIN
jgi:hypothetical protein